jgi:DNA-binding CsgD family transcriptional regulator
MAQIMDLDVREESWEKVKKRSITIGECVLPIRGRTLARTHIRDKVAATVNKHPLDLDISVRCSDGITRRAHHIVYEHFHGPCPIGSIIQRTCKTPGCIAYKHLIAVTYEEREAIRKSEDEINAAITEDARRGLKKHVMENGLSEKEVMLIWENVEDSIRQIALNHGCSPSTVYRIKHGLTRSSVTGIGGDREIKPTREDDGRKTITEEQIVAIRADNRSSRKIAEQYGISHVSVTRIKNHTQRRNVVQGDEPS